MILNTLAFLAGIVALQFSAELPPCYSYSLALPALCAIRWPLLRLPAVFVAGFFWAALRAELALLPVLPPDLEGRTILVEGRVEDIPRRLADNDYRFLFAVERMNAGDGWAAHPMRARLAWYRAVHTPRYGEQWRLAVRLKRPHGYANPGGFDFERWMLQRRIHASGYVRTDDRNAGLGMQQSRGGATLRQAVAEQFGMLVADTPGIGLIRALTIGDRSAVTPEQWRVLRATGTGHLMAISGLHISLVAGMVFWLMRRVWSLSGGLAERLPAGKAAAGLALVAAVGYAGLAGWSIPTRRALVMLAVALLALMAGRQTRPGHLLCLALIATLVVDPLSVLAPGWWLSFWAVTLIIYINAGRLGIQGWWQRWTWVHLVLAVSLVPLLLAFFQQASLVAPAANVIAVPWTGLLVVPPALLGVVLLPLSPSAGSLLLKLAAASIDTLWPYLEWLGRLDPALLHQHQPVSWTLVPAVAGILLLFSPRGFPGRWAGLVLLLVLFSVRPPLPATGEVRATLLDVGQGLASVIRTRNHVLVYDAGPAYGKNFDTGAVVVAPFLHSQGITRIDKLVVSHGDNDHSGGVASLIRQVPVNELTAGVPAAITLRTAQPCRRGDHWQWDAVRFEVLHPDAAHHRTGNNASCVIRVESAAGSQILLTGDIEAVSETALVRDDPGRLGSAVVIAPHHGSRTSSTEAFVRAVDPDYVLFPVGYRNRYGFPHRKVMERYRRAGARLLDTARHGAIEVQLPAGRPEPVVIPWRCQHRRYWRAGSCVQ